MVSAFGYEVTEKEEEKRRFSLSLLGKKERENGKKTDTMAPPSSSDRLTERLASRARALSNTLVLLDRMMPRAGSDVAKLTDRQYAVLRHLAQGLSNVGIGTHLGITEKSVQNHINAIYAGLQIDADPARNPRVSAALRLIEETGRA